MHSAILTKSELQRVKGGGETGEQTEHKLTSASGGHVK